MAGGGWGIQGEEKLQQFFRSAGCRHPHWNSLRGACASFDTSPAHKRMLRIDPTGSLGSLCVGAVRMLRCRAGYAVRHADTTDYRL